MSSDRAESGLAPRVDGKSIPGGWRDVASALDRSVARKPGAEALVGRFHRYSYAELDAAINAAAAALRALGVGQGDRVAASAANHPDIVIAFFAVQRLGGIWVGLNRLLAGPEKAFVLQDSGAKVLLADAPAREQVEALRGELPGLAHIVDMEPGPRANEWLRLIAANAGAPRPSVTIDPHAPAAIAYTSGTTGRAKGVVHSQHNMILVAATFHEGVRGPHWRPEMRQGVSLSLTILNLVLLDPLKALSGGGACICIDRADSAGVVEWVERERIETFTCAPPTLYDFLAKPEFGQADLSSLEFVSSGGAATPFEVLARLRDEFGLAVLGGYGLTEAPTNVTLRRPEWPLKPGAAGRAMGHVKVAILDPEGRELPAGETGEVCVRAIEEGPWAGVYTPMLGYWGRPEATAETLRDGWMHTGDIAMFDEEGDIFIKDRLKEMIIRGGANIYPAEVERVLMADPRVRAAAVVGKPDERLGETVAAFIETGVAAADRPALLADLEAACAEQLARYKMPERWAFVDQMPRNAMNKVVKPEIRAMARDMA